MKRKVPKKNISSWIADIEEPRKEEPENFTPIKEKLVEAILPRRKMTSGEQADNLLTSSPKISSFKKFLVFILAVFLVAAGWFGFRMYAKWSELSALFSSAEARLKIFSGGVSGQGEPSENPAAPETVIDGLDLFRIKILFGGAGEAYKNFQIASLASFDLVNEFNAIKNNWPDFLLNGKGEEFIGELKNIKKDLSAIREADKKLAELNLGLEKFFSSNESSRLSFRSDLERWENFLDSLTGWLEADQGRRLLVLLGNSSELRPGGGFLGSYLDLTLRKGNIEKLEVYDINDADRELDKRIVPPKPLQVIATRWRAADSNWFFDYSLSAGKTIELLEKSKKYSRDSISFDAALAISPIAASDILELTGPIEVAGRLINKDNFLTEIQKEVQLNQNSGHRKDIIKTLAPLVVDKLKTLQNGGGLLSEKFLEWLNRKDLMFYFKEPKLENFFDFYQAAGKVFELPKNFNGDYLAAVNANIGGAKTDLFIKQKVIFRTQLELDGSASNQLTVIRDHQGNKSPFWWYRLPNEDYLQIFTLPGAALVNASGGQSKKITPRINYARSGYSIDSLVAELEAGLKKDFNHPEIDVFTESGKNVFATWLKTNVGQTTQAVFDYKVRLFSPPAAGLGYAFVFEKQAATSGEYQFEIYAPIGFRWKENNLPVFEYSIDNPPGRLIFNLTMEKIK